MTAEAYSNRVSRSFSFNPKTNHLPCQLSKNKSLPKTCTVCKFCLKIPFPLLDPTVLF